MPSYTTSNSIPGVWRKSQSSPATRPQLERPRQKQTTRKRWQNFLSDGSEINDKVVVEAATHHWQVNPIEPYPSLSPRACRRTHSTRSRISGNPPSHATSQNRNRRTHIFCSRNRSPRRVTISPFLISTALVSPAGSTTSYFAPAIPGACNF